MVALPSMSRRGTALARTFAAALSALVEHGKHYPAEQQQLADMLAAHLRAAWPMSLSLPDPVLADPPVVVGDRPLRIDLQGGAFCEVGRTEDGRSSLYLHDVLECDAAATLTDAQAETIVRALEAAMGGGR